MVSQGMIYVLMGMVVLFGSINTIANKIQNHSIALKVEYRHVWFLTFLMFIGESFCLLVYLCLPKEKVKDDDEDKKEISCFYLTIPPLFDLIGTTLMTFGLTMMAGSVYQMFRGSVIIFTALLSVFYLKNRHYLHHYIGLVLVVLGLLLVGLAANKSTAGASTSLWGILLIIISQLFTATQFIYEEKIMKQYICHPLKAVGWEGIWGSSFMLVLLIIFNFIKCPNDPPSPFISKICTVDNKGVWRVENTLFAFRQLGSNYLLLGMTILFICSIAVFNVAGISVSKYTTGTARAVVDSLRTVVVWGFFMMSFVPEKVREKFSWLQLVGFILLVLGTLIYNEVLRFSWCFNYTYESDEKENEEKKKEMNEDKTVDGTNGNESRDEDKNSIKSGNKDNEQESNEELGSLLKKEN